MFTSFLETQIKCGMSILEHQVGFIFQIWKPMRFCFLSLSPQDLEVQEHFACLLLTENVKYSRQALQFLFMYIVSKTLERLSSAALSVTVVQSLLHSWSDSLLSWHSLESPQGLCVWVVGELTGPLIRSSTLLRAENTPVCLLTVSVQKSCLICVPEWNCLIVFSWGSKWWDLSVILLIFPSLYLQLYGEAADYSNKSPKPFLKGASYPNRSQWITEIAITEDLKKETISCADKAEAK